MIEVIKIGAEWCGPCKMMQPIIANLAQKYNVEGSPIKIIASDVDLEPTVAAKYGVRSVPTIVFLKDGELKDIKIGVLSEALIEEIIFNLIGS